MQNLLELFKSVERNPIHGSTVINHRIRIKLKLSCDEYVLIDLIHKLMITNKVLSKERIRNWTGFTMEEVKPLFKSLKEKGLYGKVRNKEDKLQYVVTKRYQLAHKIEIDDDFEYFWQKSSNKTWTGSKKAGKMLYVKLVSKYGSEYLNAQKDAYFEYLSHTKNDWRHVMNVTTFLSIEKDRFNEAWSQYTKDIKAGKKPDIPEIENTITSREDVNKKFE
jgi:hypothetical protein